MGAVFRSALGGASAEGPADHVRALSRSVVVAEGVTTADESLGRVTIEAIWARDYPVIMATTLLATLAVVAGSTVADLLYRWADPRVRG